MHSSALHAFIIAAIANTAAGLGICSRIDVHTGGCDATSCKQVNVPVGILINIVDLHLPGSGQTGLPAACFFNTADEPGFDMQLRGANGQSAYLSNFGRSLITGDFNWVVAGQRALGHAGFPVTKIVRTGDSSPPIATTTARHG